MKKSILDTFKKLENNDQEGRWIELKPILKGLNLHEEVNWNQYNFTLEDSLQVLALICDYSLYIDNGTMMMTVDSMRLTQDHQKELEEMVAENGKGRLDNHIIHFIVKNCDLTLPNNYKQLRNIDEEYKPTTQLFTTMGYLLDRVVCGADINVSAIGMNISRD